MDGSVTSTLDRSPPSAVAGFESAWVRASGIEGWLSKEQGAVLYEAARSVRDDTWIVEIGSHHGRSTILLASAKPRSANFLTIDPFPDPPLGGGELAYRALCENLDRFGLRDEVHILRATSEEAAPAAQMVFEVASQDQSKSHGLPASDVPVRHPRDCGIGLLYVDGLHDRQSVLADIEGWEPFVVEGGLVCFHDSFFRIGVTLALLQKHFMNTRFHYLGSTGSLAVFVREKVVPAGTALSDSLRLLMRFRYLARNAVVTVALRKKWKPVLMVVPPEDSCEYWT
jgi:hypothetical protein